MLTTRIVLHLQLNQVMHVVFHQPSTDIYVIPTLIVIIPFIIGLVDFVKALKAEDLPLHLPWGVVNAQIGLQLLDAV